MRRIVVTSWLASLALLLAVASGSFTKRVQAQVATDTSTPVTTLTPQLAATVTPAATARQLPSSTPLIIEPLTIKIFPDITFMASDLNSIAVDADDNVYVPDAHNYIHVFTRNFDEFRRIPVGQATAVAFNRARDVLLVGHRYPASIEQLTPDGRSLGSLWTVPNTILDLMSVDQKDMIYAVFTGVNAPYARSLIKLDLKGNIIYQQEISPTTLAEDTVYSLAFASDGNLIVTVSGYGRAPDLLTFWEFSPAGDRLVGQPPILFTSMRLRPPGYLLRLADGKLVLYGGEGLGWWSADGRPLTLIFWGETVGSPARPGGKHGGIALGSDGQTIFYADINDKNQLVLGRTRLAG